MVLHPGGCGRVGHRRNTIKVEDPTTTSGVLPHLTTTQDHARPSPPPGPATHLPGHGGNGHGPTPPRPPADSGQRGSPRRPPRPPDPTRPRTAPERRNAAGTAADLGETAPTRGRPLSAQFDRDRRPIPVIFPKKGRKHAEFATSRRQAGKFSNSGLYACRVQAPKIMTVQEDING